MPNAKPAKNRQKLRLKRIYEPVDGSDGFRILVDRLWPRGLSRESAHVDLWLKDISPSDDLRRRFHVNLEKFDEFRKAYAKELSKPPASEAVGILQGHLKKGPVILLYAARDEAHNNAVVLMEWLSGNPAVAKSKEPRSQRGSNN